MKRGGYFTLVALVLALSARVLLAQSQPTISVLRDPGCGCCLNWVAHLQKAGFKVSIAESPEMDAVKDRRGVPKAARSCHTGVIDGYVIEGHVPAADIQAIAQGSSGGRRISLCRGCLRDHQGWKCRTVDATLRRDRVRQDQARPRYSRRTLIDVERAIGRVIDSWAIEEVLSSCSRF